MALIKKPGTTKGIGAASLPGAAAHDPKGTAIPGNGSAATSTPVMQPGVTLQDRYLIEGTLGIGGMSVVYRGRDLRFKDVYRACAIKEMYQIVTDGDMRQLNLSNFEREAGLLATLQHPGIPRVYDFFEENGRVYLILELVPGHDLEVELDRLGGPVDQARVARWAVQLCDVLTYLHSRQPEAIVFRDLKPSNIMVTPDDRIVLIDFGIARNLTRADKKGTVIGTEGYSPPEQYRGVAEPRGDIYAMGATLHHLLTASDPRLETPFTFHERPLAKLNPELAGDLVQVVNRALEYDPNNRWQTASDVRAALQATSVLGGTPVGASVAPGAPAAPRVQPNTTTELVWKFKCEDEVRSSPCVASGLVFVGCYDTNLYAVDAGRGEFRWKYATEGGISSSPAICNDTVIFGSEDGGVYALDLRRGSQRWVFRTGKPVRSSPRVEERVVIVGSDDQHLYALDGSRGSQIWSYRTWMPIRSSPTIAEGSVFFGGGDGYVYSLAIKNGGLRWKQRTQQPVIASPTYADGLVLVGSMDNTFYGLDADGGFPVWKLRTTHYVNSTAYVVGSRAYVGGVDGNLYAVETKNGKVAWKYETGSQITSSPRVEGGRVYVGAADGFVYAIDTTDGSLSWRYATGGPVVSSPTIVEGVVYIGSMDQHLYALRA